MSQTPRDIDVLILGAGINGAALYRDLCEQGLDCVIVDKADFGSGTSAAPSRLIHGGLKYLETGEFGLVAQSTLERNLLLRNAPHRVEPLATVIPIFSWLKGIPAALRTLFGSTTAPRSRGAVLIKIGLSLYDFYGSRRRVMPRHQLWSRRKALAEVPFLTPRIVAAGLYYDARITNPERLVLELVRDGMATRPGAQALNHTEITGVDGGLIELQRPDGERLKLRPKIVVNAAGPWIDKVNAQLGAPTKLIGGTKGSHILIDHPELLAALKGRMIYFEADDGRICLVFEYLGRALVGSSDSRADDPDGVACDDGEIDYFLGSLRALLPGLNITRDQIVFAYSGIRPLPASDAANPGLISRDHSAPVQEAGDTRPWPIISLVGGKWTTFRGFAEEVADLVLARLGQARRIGTQGLAIGGGRDFPKSATERKAWIERHAPVAGTDADRPQSLARASLLLDRYGTAASAVLAAEALGDGAMLADATDHSIAEIGWIGRTENVVHLDDVVLRRTSLAVTGRLSQRDLEKIASILAHELGWSRERMDQELERTLAILSRKHRLIPR